MAKKSGKSVSFDAMIKFFMLRFEIPTRQDIQRIMNRLDQLEKNLEKKCLYGKSRRQTGTKSLPGDRLSPKVNRTSNATSAVFKAITDSEDGLDYEGIHTVTGFDEKKIRNIIHRLHKTGKIVRRKRGLYVAA